MDLSKLGNGIYDFADSLRDVVHQISLFKEKDVGLNCEVWIMKKDHNVEEYKGMLTPDKIFLYVPDAGRVHIYPNLFRKGKRQIAFVPEGTHAGVNEELLKGVSDAVKHNVLVKWKHGRKWVTTKVTDVTSTIDWNIFDNDFSPQFASHSFLVIQTKILHFLKEQTNIKLILMIVSAFLLGAVMGFMGSMLVYLLLLMFGGA